MGSPQNVPLGIFRLMVSRGLEVSRVHRRSSRSSCIFSQGFETVSPTLYPIASSGLGGSPPPTHTSYRPYPFPSFTSPPDNALLHTWDLAPPPTLSGIVFREVYAANLYPTMDGITMYRGSSPSPNLISHHQSRSTHIKRKTSLLYPHTICHC